MSGRELVTSGFEVGQRVTARSRSISQEVPVLAVTARTVTIGWRLANGETSPRALRLNRRGSFSLAGVEIDPR